MPTDKNLVDMFTKGLTAEVRNKLHATMAQIAEAVAYGRSNGDYTTSSDSKLQVYR